MIEATTEGRVPLRPAAFDPSVRPSVYELIDLHNRNRIDYNDRKWETVKFFQGIFSALIVATVAAVIAALGQEVFDLLAVRLLIAAMPLSSAAALWCGLANLRRESRLLLLDEYQIFKLARIAGLDVELLPEDRWLANDPYLLLDAWRANSRVGTGGFVAKTPTDWVDARLQCHTFLRLITRLFAFEGLLAILIVALIVRWTSLVGWLATSGW